MEEPRDGSGDALEDAGVKSRVTERRTRSWHAFLSSPCHAGERRRYRETTIRHTAQHNEEWQDIGPKRALCATRPGHPGQLRHRLDGAAFNRVLLGRYERK